MKVKSYVCDSGVSGFCTQASYIQNVQGDDRHIRSISSLCQGHRLRCTPFLSYRAHNWARKVFWSCLVFERSHSHMQLFTLCDLNFSQRQGRRETEWSAVSASILMACSGLQQLLLESTSTSTHTLTLPQASCFLFEWRLRQNYTSIKGEQQITLTSWSMCVSSSRSLCVGSSWGLWVGSCWGLWVCACALWDSWVACCAWGCIWWWWYRRRDPWCRTSTL